MPNKIEKFLKELGIKFERGESPSCTTFYCDKARINVYPKYFTFSFKNKCYSFNYTEYAFRFVAEVLKGE